MVDAFIIKLSAGSLFCAAFQNHCSEENSQNESEDGSSCTGVAIGSSQQQSHGAAGDDQTCSHNNEAADEGNNGILNEMHFELSGENCHNQRAEEDADCGQNQTLQCNCADCCRIPIKLIEKAVDQIACVTNNAYTISLRRMEGAENLYANSNNGGNNTEHKC